MTRQIVLDTETTGIGVEQGHRLIEIGCIEMIDRRLTGRHFHHYLQPDREIDAEAQKVHGISLEFLQDKPRFPEIAADFLDFVRDAELIIHNAPFDVGFLNAELRHIGGFDALEAYCTITDTLEMARRKHPGLRNSLDALCKRYGIDNSNRTLHGALLDASILAEVYLAMTGGQTTLSLEAQGASAGSTDAAAAGTVAAGRRFRIIPCTAEELAAHQARLEEIEGSSRGQCLWNRLQPEPGGQQSQR